MDWTENKVGRAVSDSLYRVCGRQNILREGDRDEVEALICNQAISEKLLEELYQHTGIFAGLPDERWRQVVAQSSRNERLNTDKSNFIGPLSNTLGDESILPSITAANSRLTKLIGVVSLQSNANSSIIVLAGQNSD